MLTWNSRFSIAVDWIFGFLPSILLGALCAIGLYLSLDGLLPSSNPETDLVVVFDLEMLLMSTTGLLACCSMVIVTLQRANTNLKWLHIVLLTMGILIAFRLFWRSEVFPFQPANGITTQETLTLVLSFAPYLSIVLVAIKHIIMLTRGAA